MRSRSIDKLRGLAILLMVLDHALSVFDTGTVLRLTLTRASLPIFMLISGYLLAFRNPSRKRFVQLAASAVAATVLVQNLPNMSRVDVLLVITIVLSFWPIARRFPIVALCIGMVQSQTFIITDFYSPGYLLALMCAGSLLAQTRSAGDLQLARSLATNLPDFIGTIGRNPLTWYLAHLCILMIIVQIFNAVATG